MMNTGIQSKIFNNHQMDGLGVSLSIKACRQFGLTQKQVLITLNDNLPIKRFRIMSYWDEIEATKNHYDFSSLDEITDFCKKNNIDFMLCLGMRQPRWPETHLPNWAKQLNSEQLLTAMEIFIAKVVERYKNHSNLLFYQLENEALNHGIGENNNYDRQRLRAEYGFVKEIDPNHSVMMSTSNSWGIPLRRPIPDIIGFSFYLNQFQNNRYNFTSMPIAIICRIRQTLISIIHKKLTIIHELQLEPWGPKPVNHMSLNEQKLSMNQNIAINILNKAQSTGIKHIDLWGGEWWVWLKLQYGDSSMLDLLNTYYRDNYEKEAPK